MGITRRDSGPTNHRNAETFRIHSHVDHEIRAVRHTVDWLAWGGQQVNL